MTQRVRIKFCGMAREEDLAYAAALGVDAIGLIFSPLSRRCVSIEQAKKLLRVLPPFVDVIAVLVNPDYAKVKEIISQLAIRTLQFHGDETEEFCLQFDRPYIKALQIQSTAAFEEFSAKYPQASAFLLDTPSSTNRGGTGESFDWGIIPSNRSKPVILAGGLHAQNVKLAVEQCSPYAVDICSGIEVSPGIKDHKKMRQFISALRGMT